MNRLVPATRTATPLTLTGYSAPLPGPADGTASVGELWRILWCRRKLIVGVAVAAFVGTLIYCLITPPLYKAAAELIIDPRDRQVMVNEVNPSGIAPDGGITQVESQARVIASSSVLLRAIKATGLTADPEYNGSADPFGWLTGLFETTPPTSAEALVAKTLAGLRKNLDVKRADKVFVVEVDVTSRSAEKAARIANAIADGYLVDQAATKQESGEEASAGLSARLDEQRRRVQEAADRVERYKAAHNIVVAGNMLVTDQQMADISTQLAAAQTRTAALRAQVEQIAGVRGGRGTVDSTAEALASPVVQKLREQESTLVQQQADLAARLGPNHPAIASIRSQLANVRGLIGAELGRISTSAQADYQRALNDERLLTAQFNKLKAASLASGQASVELRELERDLDAARSVYTAFLTRAQETREQAGIDTTNARVITRAIPPQRKYWPPVPLLLIGAVGSGLGLGAGLALIREYASPTILSRPQVERAVDAPVVGVFPALALTARMSDGRGGPPAGAAPPQALAVAGLALRRMFEIDPIARDPSMVHSIVVTAGPQDTIGRIRACKLLATAAAMRGQRVLLVNGDLAVAHPEGESERVSHTAGLLDVLQGECPLEDVIDPLAPSGVALLGAGRNRRALVAAEGRGFAGRMLTEARKYFDVVVIDGGILAENLRIAPLIGAAEEVLLVARLAATSQRDAVGVADAANVMGQPISAVLLYETMS
jgi:uncharacterized protein involved in exopolysaccharide biosynthesis/Mrp family chromosome partitioning ATPase